MLQGVWGVTGTGIPWLCGEKGVSTEPARMDQLWHHKGTTRSHQQGSMEQGGHLCP